MAEGKVRLSGTNLARAADHNLRITLQAIRVHKVITRVALAKLTGLTAPAIANIVRRLGEDGLIQEIGRLRQGRGQPGKLLQINPAARFSLGINLDRDHVSMVLVDFLGQRVAERHWEIDFALPAQVQALFRTHAPAMLAEADVEAARLIGVGVAMPDDLGSIAIPGAPPSYAGWAGQDAGALFDTPFDVPVFVENDASAAALGEQQFGSGMGMSSALYILISSGLGGGLLIDGHYLRGAAGRSGEIGLIPVGRGPERVQDHVSLSGLSRALSASGLTLSDLARWAQDENVLAAFDHWLERAVECLVPPLAAANCLFNPAGVVIGSRLPTSLVQRLAGALNRALRSLEPRLPACAPIRCAALAGNAAAIGAALLPFSHILLPRLDTLWKEEVET